MNIYPVRWDCERAYYALRPPCPRRARMVQHLFRREAAEERRSSARPSLPSAATTTTTILLLLRIFTAVTVCVLCCGAPL